MDDLDGGRLDAERLRGEYVLKEGASEEELELRMMTMKVAGCAQSNSKQEGCPGRSSDGALCSGPQAQCPKQRLPRSPAPTDRRGIKEWVVAPHS